MAETDDPFESFAQGSKRKLDIKADPTVMQKVIKLDRTEDRRHKAHVEEAEHDEQDENYGPDLPPGEADNDDDEEGRFFGGGISKEESHILDFVETADPGETADKIDHAWLRRTALNFERRITKNAELRAKYETEPQKFISSEADLDSDIRGLSVLTENPYLYTEFVELGCANSLVGLLAHENTDIAISAIEIIGELTDEDVAAEGLQWKQLVDSMVNADLVGLIGSNLTRFNEDDEADRNGIYHALGVIENCCSQTTTASRFGQEDKLLYWLLERVQRIERPTTQNKQYAAEILALLSQASKENRQKLAEMDAVDILLQTVAPYRKREPDRGSEEEEFVENVFETLTCILDGFEGKAKFLEAEGVELCVILLKEAISVKPATLRLLDHGVSGQSGVPICQKVVQVGGLKHLFTLFMKKQERWLVDHMLSIFATMLRFLPPDSDERIRVLAKFVEKDYEKIRKLFGLRREYANRMRKVETEFRLNKNGDLAMLDNLQIELMSVKLDAGLYIVQLTDVILAWLSVEDAGAKNQIRRLLADGHEDFGAITATLNEQLEGIDLTMDDARELRDMLEVLIEYLR